LFTYSGESETAVSFRVPILILLFIFPYTASAEDRLYYFWSFSIPKNTIQEVLTQGEKIGLVAVLRGLPERPMKESLRQLQETIGGRKTDVQIDPILFSLYRVSTVPAYVYAEGIDTDCEHCQPPIRYWMVLGDVPLETALERIARSSASAETRLKKLREGYYEKGR